MIADTIGEGCYLVNRRRPMFTPRPRRFLYPQHPPYQLPYGGYTPQCLHRKPFQRLTPHPPSPCLVPRHQTPIPPTTGVGAHIVIPPAPSPHHRRTISCRPNQHPSAVSHGLSLRRVRPRSTCEIRGSAASTIHRHIQVMDMLETPGNSTWACLLHGACHAEIISHAPTTFLLASPVPALASLWSTSSHTLQASTGSCPSVIV